MSIREGSRPDPHAPTELAHVAARRERTDEHWPPPSPPNTGSHRQPVRIASFREAEKHHELLQRDLEEHGRALKYVEEDARRALRELDGEGQEPGIRTLVHTLTKGMEAVNVSVVKQQESTRSTQRSVVLALFVIAAALAWMALRNGP